MNTVKELVRDLLQQANIAINGSSPWDITIHDEQFYQRVLTDTDLGLGETYMDKAWDCPSLDQFFYKIMSSNLKDKAYAHPKFWRNFLVQKIYEKLHAFFNFQTKEHALLAGGKHYDTGNDLYQKMLDKRLVYTCAYWEGAKNLDEAQEKKLELTCQKLKLKPGMKILDIGCGFGSFAKYAAEKFDVSVVGITISKQQLELGQSLCSGLPVQLQLLDYRDLAKNEAQYDRIVSLGMFEHVGFKNYLEYMKVAFHCLKDKGLFLLHTIGGNDSCNVTSRWINSYIFQTGHLPSIAQIGKSIEKLFVMEDWHNFGVDYDKTLMAWHQNFNRHWHSLKQSYSDRFYRMWNYYLLMSAASFRARENQLWQIVLSKGDLTEGYKRI